MPVFCFRSYPCYTVVLLTRKEDLQVIVLCLEYDLLPTALTPNSNLLSAMDAVPGNGHQVKLQRLPPRVITKVSIEYDAIAGSIPVVKHLVLAEVKLVFTDVGFSPDAKMTRGRMLGGRNLDWTIRINRGRVRQTVRVHAWLRNPEKHSHFVAALVAKAKEALDTVGTKPND
jgi:hypothetical protein